MTTRLGLEFEPLNPSVQSYWRVNAIIGGLVGLAVVALGLLLRDFIPMWVYIVAASIIVVLVIIDIAVVVPLRYRRSGWRLDNIGLHEISGAIFMQYRTSPLAKVQTITSSQGPIQRGFKITTIKCATAAAGHVMTITGLDMPTTERVVTAVREAANISEDGT